MQTEYWEQPSWVVENGTKSNPMSSDILNFVLYIFLEVRDLSWSLWWNVTVMEGMLYSWELWFDDQMPISLYKVTSYKPLLWNFILKYVNFGYAMDLPFSFLLSFIEKNLWSDLKFLFYGLLTWMLQHLTSCDGGGGGWMMMWISFLMWIREK